MKGVNWKYCTAKKQLKRHLDLLSIIYFIPEQVLTGLDLNIRKGETVALVGSSGCGKSTCIQLIQRFYDPDLGSIKLGKWNIKDLNIGWLRDRSVMAMMNHLDPRANLFKLIKLYKWGTEIRDLCQKLGCVNSNVTRLTFIVIKLVRNMTSLLVNYIYLF